MTTVVNGISFTRVASDKNGNPRYVFSWTHLANSYAEAIWAGKTIGAKKYRGKDFGGGLVIQSYNLQFDANLISQIGSAVKCRVNNKSTEAIC